MAKANVASIVEELITPTVQSCDCSIWDVEFVREGADWHLIVTIDTTREGGITLDDCERVTRAIDPLIDEADPIDVSYSLEVSSPGVERALTKPWHVTWAIGQKVEVKLFRPQNGTKRLVGILDAFDGSVLTLLSPEAVTVPYGDVAKMKTVFFD